MTDIVHRARRALQSEDYELVDLVDIIEKCANEVSQLRELLREVLMDDDSNVDFQSGGLSSDLHSRIEAALK